MSEAYKPDEDRDWLVSAIVILLFIIIVGVSA
jgi:hypothetical protein